MSNQLLNQKSGAAALVGGQSAAEAEYNPFNLRLEWRDPRTLQPNPLNWKSHPGAQRDAFGEFFDDVGWVGALLFNEETGKLLDGHMRQQEAIERNLEIVPVLVVNVPEHKENEILAWLDDIGVRFGENKQARKLLMETIGNSKLSDLLNDDDDGESILDLLEKKKGKGLPEGGISLVPGEAYNTVVLVFKKEMDWIAAQDHFGLKTVKCAFSNGTGMGRIVDGGKYLSRIFNDQWNQQQSGGADDATTE